MKYLFRLLLCGVGLMSLVMQVVAADTAASAIAPEIRKCFHALELPQRFAEERTAYLEFMRSQAMPGGGRVAHEIGQRIIAADYETPLCTFLAARFSPDEAKAISAYLAKPVGKRQLREMRKIYKEMRTAPKGTIKPGELAAKFNATLTREEKQTVAAFSATEPGKKYWAELGAVDTKLTELFQQFAQQILAKIAAEHGLASPTPPQPSNP